MQAEVSSLFNTANAVKGSKYIKKRRYSDVVYVEDATIELQPRKRVKGTGKSKVGKLEGLMSVPMDILFEVRWVCMTIYLRIFSFRTSDIGTSSTP